MAALMSGSSRISGGTWLRVRGVRRGAAGLVSSLLLAAHLELSQPFCTLVVSTSFWAPSFCACASAVRLPTNRFLGCRRLLPPLASGADPFIASSGRVNDAFDSAVFFLTSRSESRMAYVIVRVSPFWGNHVTVSALSPILDAEQAWLDTVIY